jgi:ABC-2 type transport system permease protein
MVVFATVVLPLVGLDEWRLGPPVSLAAGAGFALALVCALALACAISTLVNITMLWTIQNDGVLIIVTSVVSLLSGLLVPLPLLPDWAQPVVRWLPFAGVLDLPYRIYNGHIAPDGLPLVLARQLGWTLALVALGRWWLGRGMRRLVVQGG